MTYINIYIKKKGEFRRDDMDMLQLSTLIVILFRQGFTALFFNLQGRK